MGDDTDRVAIEAALFAAGIDFDLVTDFVGFDGSQAESSGPRALFTAPVAEKKIQIYDGGQPSSSYIPRSSETAV